MAKMYSKRPVTKSWRKGRLRRVQTIRYYKNDRLMTKTIVHAPYAISPKV